MSEPPTLFPSSFHLSIHSIAHKSKLFVTMVVYRTRLEPFSRFLYSLIINTAFFFVLKFIPSRSPKSFSFPVGYDGTDVSVDAAIDLAMAKGMSRLFTNTLIAGLPTLLLLWAQTQLFVPDFWFLNAAFASLLTTGDLVTWWTVLLKFVFTVPRPTFLAVCQPSKEEIARQWSLLSTEQQSKHRFQVNLDVCASTVASSALRDQLSGFPSGTIAAVFGASTISILLIHTVLKPFTTERTSPVRLFAMTSPLLVAAWITADRLHQNVSSPVRSTALR